MAQLIAAATSYAVSADFVLAAGASTTLSLRPNPAGALPSDALGAVYVRGSGADYVYIGEITAAHPLRVLTAVGTFRVARFASTIGYGVDRD